MHSALLRETLKLPNGKNIQRASLCKPYRTSKVPRKFGTTNEYLQHHLEHATTEVMIDAVVGTPFVLVTPSQDNEIQHNLLTTS